MGNIRAFDTSIGNNFTNDACPNFFQSFTTNTSFNDCVPMSFYLQNSQSYIKQVRKGIDTIEKIVDRSCDVDFAKCRKLMSEFDDTLMKQCKDDYNQENPLVLQAHNDFTSYSMIHEATCLQYKQFPSTAYSNSTTTSTNNNDKHKHAKYCYTNALFGDGAKYSLDAYLYSLPFGQAYPDTTGNTQTFTNPNGSAMTTTCSKCTQDLMEVFRGYTADRSLGIADTYVAAAKKINKHCKPGFVNESRSASQPNPSQSDSAAWHPQAALKQALVLMLVVQFLLAFLI